jgi:hypothetical protein
LRKSFTAWLAFAADPPTPRKKIRPFFWRASASLATIFSMAPASSLARI